MEREDLISRTTSLLHEADTATLKLIYRFVCGIIYKRIN